MNRISLIPTTTIICIRLIMFFFLFFTSQFSWCQISIQGQVRSGVNQEPLPYANVFLSGTTKGTVTDDKGLFILDNLPRGKFDLIVSFVGFTTLKTTVQTQLQQKYQFILKPLDKQLNDVNIVARRRRNSERAGQLILFMDYFLGRSQNRLNCRLLNSDVLSFVKKGDSLVVTANEALLIENYALGYKIKVQLELFTYNYSLNQVSYQGNPVYEPIKPRNEKEAQRWLSNRRNAYFGSMMHFGRALYKHEVVSEGFTFQQVIERWNRRGELKMVGLPGDTVVSAQSLIKRKKLIELPMANYKIILDSIRSTPVRPVITFSDLIQVTYTKERESYDFRRERRSYEDTYKELFQRSLLRMLSKDFTVEENGQFWPPHSFRAEGYWAWEMVADDLPFDYDPNEFTKN